MWESPVLNRWWPQPPLSKFLPNNKKSQFEKRERVGTNVIKWYIINHHPWYVLMRRIKMICFISVTKYKLHVDSLYKNIRGFTLMNLIQHANMMDKNIMRWPDETLPLSHGRYCSILKQALDSNPAFDNKNSMFFPPAAFVQRLDAQHTRWTWNVASASEILIIVNIMRTLNYFDKYFCSQRLWDVFLNIEEESRFYHIWPDVNGAGFYAVQVAFIWAMLQKVDTKNNQIDETQKDYI